MADLKTAIQRYQEALDTTPADHPDRAGQLYSLGNEYQDRYRRTGVMADLETAIQRFQEALDATPSHHPERAARLYGLGTEYSDRYQRTGAMTDLETAIQRFQEALDTTPVDHPDRAARLHGLGIGYSDRYQGTRAMADLETVHNPGNLYSDQGKMKEAEEMYLRALTRYEKAWGPEHTSTLDTVNNLGNLYLDQGKMKEAEGMYLRALAGKEKAWGPEHTSTLDTVNNLGNLYKNQDKLKEAESMYVRALAGYEKTLGPNHASALDTVNNLGNLYRDQGKTAEAEAMYVRALAGKEIVWRPDQSSTFHTINNLAIRQKQQQKDTFRATTRNFIVLSDSGYGSMRLSLAERTKAESDTTNLHQHLSEEAEYPYYPVYVGNTPSLADESRIGSMAGSVFELLLEVIRDDPVLEPLFDVVIKKKGRQIAITSLEEFIKGYCLLLRAGNPDLNQSRTIQFLRHRAKRVAEIVYEPQQSADSFDYAEARKLGNERVMSFLNDSAIPHAHPESNAETESVAFNDNTMEGWSGNSDASAEPEGSDHSSPDWPALPEGIQEIKAFPIQGEPMQLFRRHYRSFVNDEPLDGWNGRVRYEVEKTSVGQAAGDGHTPTEPLGPLKPASVIDRDDTEESIFTATELFTQNPQSYFESVDSLQSQVFDLGRMALGNIKQDGTIHVLSLPAPAFPLPETILGISECILPLLKRDLEMVSAILNGIHILTDAHFCKATYNIIVSSAQRHNVLSVVPITLPTLEFLYELIEEAVLYCSAPLQWPQLKENISDISKSSALILRHLGLTTLSAKFGQNDEYQQCLHSCRLLAVL
jgi:tetratricopeptide (TPR) repeat protein